MSGLINEEVFEHKGFTCLVRETGQRMNPEEKTNFDNLFGGFINPYWFCGYVRIPEGHPFYKKDYGDLPWLSVHGGLTYSRMEKDGWTIGFDCNHYDDNPLVQDAEYTKSECISLVEQPIQIASENKTESSQ